MEVICLWTWIGEFFEGLFSTLQDRAFIHNLAHISGKNGEDLYEKFTQMYILRQRSLH